MFFCRGGGVHVLRLKFKRCHFANSEGSHITVRVSYTTIHLKFIMWQHFLVIRRHFTLKMLIFQWHVANRASIAI